MLLFMADVEVNPGPTMAELAALINNLSATVNAGFLQCNVKLDALVADVNDLKTKQATLEATVNKLSEDRDYLLREVDKLRDIALLSDVKSRERNLVISGLPISKLRAIDDFRDFMVSKLHISAHDSISHLENASVNVISELNSADRRALSIVSLKSFAVRNAILACGKHLKNTRIFISPDLPKEVQKARKSLRPFFLASRANNLKASFIGSRLSIDNEMFSATATDLNKLRIRFPHAGYGAPLND
jgi:outer membrane murein-binding lipoprotein Lpp